MIVSASSPASTRVMKYTVSEEGSYAAALVSHTAKGETTAERFPLSPSTCTRAFSASYGGSQASTATSFAPALAGARALALAHAAASAQSSGTSLVRTRATILNTK